MTSTEITTTKGGRRRGTTSTVKRVSQASEAVLTALQELAADDSAAAYRRAASSIIELRQLFEHQGMPDWTGRSLEYRDVIERLYRQAEVPPDSESNMQAKIRYHVGNVLRDVAPADELQQLGLSVAGPKTRVAETRAAGGGRRRQPAEVTRTHIDSPLTVAALALDAVKLLRVMDIGPDDKEIVDGIVRKIMDEAIDYLRG